MNDASTIKGKGEYQMNDPAFQVALDTTIRTDLETMKTVSLVINNQDDRDRLSGYIKNAMFIESRIIAFFKTMKSNAHKTWKDICDTESSYTKECIAFKKAANASIIVYDDAKEAERQAEERRLQAIKDEEARVERERLEGEAKNQREVEEKAKADAEAARQLAEDADDTSSPVERERLIAEANEADRIASEAAAAANAKKTEASNTVAAKVTLATRVTKTAGESVRTVWKAHVVDALLVPRAYLMVNEKALDSYAKDTQGKVPIAGVEFYTEQIIVRRNV